MVVSVRPGSAQDHAAGRGDEVAQHGGRRRGAAGALAVEHQLAGVFRFDEHGVERSADGGQRVLARQQRGVDAHGHAFAAVGIGQLFGDSQQLDDESGVLGRSDVGAVTEVMPSQWTFSRANRVWKDSEARMAALAAASWPSTSAVGSASA